MIPDAQFSVKRRRRFRALFSRRLLRLTAIILLFALTAATLFLYWSRVDNSLTTQDRYYIAKILSLRPRAMKLAPPDRRSFKDEIACVRAVQAAVLAASPKSAGIAFGHAREPKDLFEGGHGLCYDRSRVIEKALRLLGFKTRHVSIFDIEGRRPRLLALLKPGLSSHAVTEVKTSRGWMVVDSNAPWIALTRKLQPLDMKSISGHAKSIDWHPLYARDPNPIYKADIVYVYGLYSRHGRFYPPYNIAPDIQWSEFLYNFFS